MNKNKQSENRKALPKFLAIILISMLVGAFFGAGASFFSLSSLSEVTVNTIYRLTSLAAPYMMWAIVFVLCGTALLFYRQAKALFSGWDGEDESIIEHAEEKISKQILVTSVSMILSLFVLSAALVTDRKFPLSGISFFILFAGFIVSLAAEIILQQKAVDLTKKINPEKRGSVYDMKFQKTWMDSCDENEQRQIGKAAMKAFNAVNGTCVILWLILLVLSSIMPIGLLPLFTVMFIWCVCQVTYCAEAIRLGRSK